MKNISNFDVLKEIDYILPILRFWGYESPVIVGRGAFARVYRIREQHTGVFWACKVSTEHEMMQKESTILQQISHPLFPKYHDYRREAQWDFLFMEYVPGVSLKEMLLRRGHMTERQSIRIGIQLAEGLCYLHEKSIPILFQDVKPENIMIKEDGKVKLLDFGSASFINETAGIITGTIGYAAPEQWTKQGKTGFYSDVYALGQVMFYMLTGRTSAVLHLKNRKMQFIYPHDIRLHRGIKKLVEECIKEDAEVRIPNMRIFLYKLMPYASGKRWKILYMEIKTILGGKQYSRYIFQQNILRF